MTPELGPRAQLFRNLAALPQPQFEELLFVLNMPPGVVGGDRAPQGDRVADLLPWAEGPTGCGLEAVKTAFQNLPRTPNSNAGEVPHFKETKACQSQSAVSAYLETALQRLKQQGCMDIRWGMQQDAQSLCTAARIQDFELPFGPMAMRGEAFFVFQEFGAIGEKQLRQFSRNALQWAKTQTHPSAVGSAVFNFRVPTHICFAVALVDEVDAATQTAIRTTNPFDHSVDLLWYEVPIIYGLDQGQLYFYDQPSGFLENFKGEVAWKPLRTVIRQLLAREYECSMSD